MTKLIFTYIIPLFLVSCTKSNNINSRGDTKPIFPYRNESIQSVSDSCCQDDVRRMSKKESIWMKKEVSTNYNYIIQNHLSIYKILDKIDTFPDKISIDSNSLSYYTDLDFSKMKFHNKVNKPDTNYEYYLVIKSKNISNLTFIKRFCAKGENSNFELLVRSYNDFDFFVMTYLGDNTKNIPLNIKGIFMRDKNSQRLYLIRYGRNPDKNDSVKYFFSKIMLLDNRLIPTASLYIEYHSLIGYHDFFYNENNIEKIKAIDIKNEYIHFKITNKTELADLDSIFCIRNKKYIRNYIPNIVSLNEPLWRYERINVKISP